MDDILALIGDRCDGVIGQVRRAIFSSLFYLSLSSSECCYGDDQLTEDWGEVLFSALKKAGGTAFSNMAVGYNNVDVDAATKYGIAVGNTPVSLNLWFFFMPLYMFMKMSGR